MPVKHKLYGILKRDKQISLPNSVETPFGRIRLPMPDKGLERKPLVLFKDGTIDKHSKGHHHNGSSTLGGVTSPKDNVKVANLKTKLDDLVEMKVQFDSFCRALQTS